MPYKDLAVRNEYHRKYREDNRELINKLARERYKNPENKIKLFKKNKIYFKTEKGRHVNRKATFKYKWKISWDEAENLLISQGSKCLICFVKLNLLDRNTHYDHDHATGKFRGFLCVTCNLGLGAFKDSPILLNSAIKYLKKEKNA